MMEAVAKMTFLTGEIYYHRDLYPGKADPESLRFDFDILPVGPRQIQLFLLRNEEMAVWDYPFHAERREREEVKQGGNVTTRWVSWAGKWDRKGAFPAPFHGSAFHVATADGAYFFITDAGGVYSAEDVKTEGKKAEWKTGALWDDAKRPIIAMLVESDGQTAWVFGKDFYFKVAKKPEVKACRDVTKGRAELGEPMRTVFECGRVLYEKGELHEKAEPKAPEKK